MAKKKPAKKKKGKKALTVKQRKYAKARAAGKDKTNAARAAGYSESTARHATETIEASENFQEYLEKLLDAHIPAEHVVKRIAEGLDAIETETFSAAIGIGQNRHIELEHVDKVAWTERRQYAALYLELKGQRKAPQKTTTRIRNGDGVSVIEVVTENIGDCAQL